MEFYHGTNADSASTIIGPPVKIDVTKGGGELGRGFYLGNEPSLAAALAKGKNRRNPRVLQFTIETAEYLKLDIRTIHKKGTLIHDWSKRRREKSTHSHLYWADVVVAPFATIDIGHQYKFESIAAGNLLNKSSIKTVL